MTHNLDLHRPLTTLDDQAETWHRFGASPVSLDDAWRIVREARQADGIVQDIAIGDLTGWGFGPLHGGAAIAPLAVPGRTSPVDRPLPLRRQGFMHLCQRIGAPSDYLRQLPAKYQIQLMNHGLLSAGKSASQGALVRTVGGEVRALLSDRYAPMDNEIVIETLDTALAAHGLRDDVRVRAVATGRSFGLRLTMPGEASVVRHDAKVGDVVETGLDLLNGEIGNRSASITPITYRLTCTNGMRSASREDARRFHHVGDPRRLEQAFRDAVPTVIARSRGLHRQMAVCLDRVAEDALREFDGLSVFGLTKTDARDVARDVMAERGVALPSNTGEWKDALAGVSDLSAWDVANGITHVAQRRAVDRRLELEEAAGAYVARRAA